MHTPTSLPWTYKQHTHQHTLIGGYSVKNRSWMFQRSCVFRGDISSSASPQGQSLQAAAEAAITALHLPAPFNWLMLFDMAEQSSQLASGRLQLGPSPNAAENFAKPWYEVTVRLKSIKENVVKGSSAAPTLRELPEIWDGWLDKSLCSDREISVGSRCIFLVRLNSPQVVLWED